MFNVLGQINWLAVAVATFAIAALGAVWFAAFFKRHYATALGREGAPETKLAAIFIAGPFLCGLVTCIASEILLRALGIDTLGDALVFGLVIGVGYLAATAVNVGINPNIPRPILYGAISGSYFLLAGVIISLILVAIG